MPGSVGKVVLQNAESQVELGIALSHHAALNTFRGGNGDNCQSFPQHPWTIAQGDLSRDFIPISLVEVLSDGCRLIECINVSMFLVVFGISYWGQSVSVSQLSDYLHVHAKVGFFQPGTGKVVGPQEITGQLLRHLLELAADYLGAEVRTEGCMLLMPFRCIRLV